MRYYHRHFLSWLIVLCCMLGFSMSAQAADPAPIAMLKSVSQQLLQQLSANQSRLKTNPQLINTLVNRIVVPHVDVRGMSRNVVGRLYWNKASSAQRNQFISLFTRQVIQTYSNAFSDYQGERVRFYPYRGTIGSGPIQVKSVILSNGQRISLNYMVAKVGSQWKVTDFIVDGISMTNSYRAQFQATLSEGGLSLLNSRLAAHLKS